MSASLKGPLDDIAAELRRRIAGRVVTASDSAYDDLRQLFYGGIDPRPPAIVRAAGAADVRVAVATARDHGLELAVRSGGHSVAGHGTTDRGIVIDLRDMRRLDIDAAGRTAWAETGLTAAAFTNVAAEHGLAVGFGDVGSVGIGGLTLGGGIGYLSRKHGLTIDSLLAAEIVTADGRLVRTDSETEPDLFWALRGGGGNFGVVTRLCFRLEPLGHCYGGMMMLPATEDTIGGFVAACEAAPEELSAIANVMPAPPMPFVPEEMHGRLVVFAIMVFAGDPAAGGRAVAPLRALAPPIVDMVRPIRLPEIYPPEDPSYRPTAVARTMFVDAVGGTGAATILTFLGQSDAPMRVAQLRVLGGAIARVPAEATAYAHRARRIMVNVAAFHGPDDKAKQRAWVDSFAAALRQGDGDAYVNFLGDEGPGRVRAAYPGATFDRLAAVKRRYDPANIFRRNQNIPPAP